MNRLSASVLGSLLALTLASGAAWAQDEGGGEAGGEEAGSETGGGEAAGTGEAVGSEVGGEATGGEMAAGAEMSMGIGPYTKANYPQEALWRPLTLPKGMIQVSPAFGYTKFGPVDATA